MKRLAPIFFCLGLVTGYTESPEQSKKYDNLGADVDKGGETSKACRYADVPWSDCDPFELQRFRVLHLIQGGRQCEEIKNITKHCTPGEFPPGTTWLIEEHRKCIAELTRLKSMIADLAKYIDALHGKGKDLFNAYIELKKHLDELRQKIDVLQKDNTQQEVTIGKVREEIENWKTNARELQSQLDEFRTKYHDLQADHKQMAQKLVECANEKSRLLSENAALLQKIHELEAENSELKRRLLDAERYKELLREEKYTIGKLEFKMEKLEEKLQNLKDSLEECRLNVLSSSNNGGVEDDKDTRVDLNMEMWIVHNRSAPITSYSQKMYTVETTEKIEIVLSPVCLISYYGITNETCWYQTKGDSSEIESADSVGHHLIEAHWKYFTINVKDQYECDKAAHLHYEFLLNRCAPKHYLPVLSIFRPDSKTDKLSTHIYPRPNVPQPGERNRCWITFLGSHGHCERHMEKYSLYNNDDSKEGYEKGSSMSANKCMESAERWSKYCETPSIATYLPDGVSSNWRDEDIQHDSHGGRMFEDHEDAKSQINPESMNPNSLNRPVIKNVLEYEDTPEFRKSLNLKGKERENILAQLRNRLHMNKPKENLMDNDVKWHGVQDTSSNLPMTANNDSFIKDKPVHEMLM